MTSIIASAVAIAAVVIVFVYLYRRSKNRHVINKASSIHPDVVPQVRANDVESNCSNTNRKGQSAINDSNSLDIKWRDGLSGDGNAMEGRLGQPTTNEAIGVLEASGNTHFNIAFEVSPYVVNVNSESAVDIVDKLHDSLGNSLSKSFSVSKISVSENEIEDIEDIDDHDESEASNHGLKLSTAELHEMSFLSIPSYIEKHDIDASSGEVLDSDNLVLNDEESNLIDMISLASIESFDDSLSTIS